MKQDRVYIALVVGLFLLLVVGLMLQPEKISWNHTYTKSDKTPFASRAVYELMPDLFPGQPIEALYIPPAELAEKVNADSTNKKRFNYIFIGDYTSFGPYDSRAIAALAAKGNHIFIAAENIVGHLADSMGVYTGYQPMEIAPDFAQPDSVKLNFHDTALYSKRSFSMRPGENDSYISISDSVEDVTVLGRNTKGNPVFVEKKIGDGYIYFNSVPLAFTNYYLLPGNNSGYISRCFSYLPVAPVFWDEFYKVGRKESQSELRVILKTPALKMAYITAIILIALYMLFQSKRRQRIIPVILPFENSTLKFVETVSRLYYNKGDHTSLAKKKLIYLLEKLRIKYQVPVELKQEDSILAISARSGVDEEATRRLFISMRHIQVTSSISEKELIEFNKIVEEFWGKAKQ